ncbi:hypothetical protein Hanom_Chr04g00315261 [Helianthus anomalus]
MKNIVTFKSNNNQFQHANPNIPLLCKTIYLYNVVSDDSVFIRINKSSTYNCCC